MFWILTFCSLGFSQCFQMCSKHTTKALLPNRANNGMVHAWPGMSHLGTFLQNTAEWRRHLRRPEYGDEREAHVREYLHKHAPLTNSAAIDAPLLLCQGANDSRVPLNETLQIADAVRSNGQPCWVMVANEEGHVFKKRTTVDLNSQIIAVFLQKFLLS